MEMQIGNFVAADKSEATIIRALSRACSENIHAGIRSAQPAGASMIAFYGKDLFSAYTVSVSPYRTTCTCKAGSAGMMCKHVAALADKTGRMGDLIEGFYERAFGSAAPAVTVIELQNCPDCCGEGYGRIYTGGGLSDWIACDCHTCANTGKVARELVAA